MTITGTSYFPSKLDAIKYYSYTSSFEGFSESHIKDTPAYQESLIEIEEKVKMGEINIGKPPLKPGETLFIKDNRYHIQGD